MGVWSWMKRQPKKFAKTITYPLRKIGQGGSYVFDKLTGRDIAKDQMSMTERINAENLANQNKINKENIELQREFAQHGISWKVDDAISAGIHPLAALGADTMSFTPSSRLFEQQAPDVSSGRANPLQLLSSIIGFKRDIEALRGLRLQNDLIAMDRHDRLKNVNAEITGGSEFYEYKKDERGYYWLAPTAQNQELVTEMNPWALKIYKNVSDRWFAERKAISDPNSPFAEKYFNWLVKTKPQRLIDGSPIPPGKEFRYTVGHGWRLYPKKNLLFSNGLFGMDQNGYFRRGQKGVSNWLDSAFENTINYLDRLINRKK